MSTAPQPIAAKLSTSAFTLLPGEDAAAFQSAQCSYRERFEPQDHHELFLIHLMVQSTYKLARVHRMQAALFTLAALDPNLPEIPAATPEAAMAAILFKTKPDAFLSLERAAQAAQKTYFKALQELERGRNPHNSPKKGVLPNEANLGFPPSRAEAGRPPAPRKPGPQPVAIEKTGRNELCPCGSGLKFKRCCLNESSRPTILDS